MHVATTLPSPENPAHARFLGKTRQRPLADVMGRVHTRDICVLYERLADDIDSEPFRGFDVCCSVFQTALYVRKMGLRDRGDRDERRALRDLH